MAIPTNDFFTVPSCMTNVAATSGLWSGRIIGVSNPALLVKISRLCANAGLQITSLLFTQNNDTVAGMVKFPCCLLDVSSKKL